MQQSPTLPQNNQHRFKDKLPAARLSKPAGPSDNRPTTNEHSTRARAWAGEIKRRPSLTEAARER